MMGFNNGLMAQGFGAGMMFFGWIIYLLLILLFVLSIAALWKYLNK
jgi:hypothetical protein